MNPQIEMALQAVDSTAVDILFGAIVLASFGLILAVLLFAGLVVRGIWRWLTCASWRDVVVSAERKAFK